MFLLEINNVSPNCSVSKPDINFMKFREVYSFEHLSEFSRFREIVLLAKENEFAAQSFLTSKMKNYKKIRIDNCIICNLNYSNFKIHVTDADGNMEYSVNSGLLQFRGSQKTSRHAILAIVNRLVSKKHYYLGRNMAIHIKGFVRKYNKLITSKVKNNFTVKLIRYYNLHPHNGCRPKKIRRLKTRTRK